MPTRSEKISTDIFSAVSSPIRLQALKLLSTKGPLSYSELMGMLNLEPAKDAGKFVYHLRNLIATNLIDIEEKTKKYKITELGNVVVSFSQSLDEYTLKKAGKLLVRTSKYAIEEFNKKKIFDSLIKEAGMPPEISGKISTEVEDRLLKLQVKYLTAPLIREFVNAVLIEKGFEEFRHKLTRLGLPVYDVAKTIDRIAQAELNSEHVQSSISQQVLTEYVLLEALPREIADAHLAGKIHIDSTGFWILNIQTLYHDLRVFLKSGLGPRQTGLISSHIKEPKTLYEALKIVESLLEAYKSEVATGQVIDHFNVFLAPFIERMPDEEIKRLIELFISSLSFNFKGLGQAVTLGLTLPLPDFLKDSDANVGENIKGAFGDYEAEAVRLLGIVFDALADLSAVRPPLNPAFTLKLCGEAFNPKYRAALHKALKAITLGCPIYLVNGFKEWQEVASYSSTGARVESEWTEDWELDVLRTGYVDNVTLNVPRVAYEAGGSDDKFFEGLESLMKTATRAFEIKQRILERRIREGLLANLSQPVNGEPYFRVKNAIHGISFVGVNEAVKAHVGRQIHEDSVAQNFALQIIEYLNKTFREIGSDLSFRILLSQLSSREAALRLARQDVEEYGRDKVLLPGGRDSPSYSCVTISAMDAPLSLKDRLQVEEKFHPLTMGGHLLPIKPEKTLEVELLLKDINDICKNHDIGLFSFIQDLSYCRQCQKTFIGLLTKCPKCKSSDVLQYVWKPRGLVPKKWVDYSLV